MLEAKQRPHEAGFAAQHQAFGVVRGLGVDGDRAGSPDDERLCVQRQQPAIAAGGQGRGGDRAQLECARQPGVGLPISGIVTLAATMTLCIAGLQLEVRFDGEIQLQ